MLTNNGVSRIYHYGRGLAETKQGEQREKAMSHRFDYDFIQHGEHDAKHVVACASPYTERRIVYDF